jgi:hypothetical protein
MGPRTLSAVSLIVFGAIVLVWFFMRDGLLSFHIPFMGSYHLPQSIVLLIIVNVPCSICGALIGTCHTTLITSKAPEEHRTLAIALFQGGISLMAAAGSFLGGYLTDTYREFFLAHPVPFNLPMGDTVSYFHVLVILQVGIVWLVLVPLHLRLQDPHSGLSFRNAILGLVTGNPMRMVTNMFNLHVLQSSPEPGRKAKAIRELGDSRTAIAVSDLITQLDDPDADVREESAMALGRIGSPEAIEGLLAKLEDAESVMTPEIVKALRKSKDPRTVSALIRKLSDEDPAIQAESARTLGIIGNKQAVQNLLDLLYASRHEKVISASSEALARLGEMDAIFKILPRMRETRNSVLKQSMGCAVGDLLGTPGEFYRVLHAERLAYGEMMGKLLARMKEVVQESTPNDAGASDQTLVAKLEQLESAFLLRDYAACVNQSLDLAIRLASMKYGIPYGGDAEVFVEVLIWHDKQFGVGTWYLDLLKQGAPEKLDAMLAIYFLSTWTPKPLPPA